MNQKEFIESVAKGAVSGWEKHKVLPSITLAQAILESNWGRSELAEKANNLFGVKGDYQGYGYNVTTWEHVNGKDITVDAWFRHYPDKATSVEDHGEFFTSTPWRKQNYAKVIGETDYKKAAQALSVAGYATDPDYSDKLIRIIEQHKLYQYDPKVTQVKPEKKGEDEHMTLKIAVDAGHGLHTAGKRTPAGEREWTFNNKNLKGFVGEINRYEGVEILIVSDPTGKRDVPLRERVDLANDWGADLYISFHHNANTGKWGNWGGTETYSYPNSARGKRLAKVLHGGAMTAYKLQNRGLKQLGFYVLRHTKMASALIEGGFMDSNIDIKVMRDDSKTDLLGVEVAKGVAKEYGRKLKSGAKPTPVVKKENKSSSDSLYRVQTGAFSKQGNASELASEIRKKGFSTYIVKVGNLYKVQVGAFANKKNAENQLKAIKDAGYKDAFITSDVTEAVLSHEPLNEPKEFNLVVDGYWGPALTKALQSYLDTYEDGEISGQVRNQVTLAMNQRAVKYGKGGSLVIRELQKKVGARVDGYLGTETLRKLQAYLGTPVDGKLSRPSLVVKELQRRLNNGTF